MTGNNLDLSNHCTAINSHETRLISWDEDIIVIFKELFQIVTQIISMLLSFNSSIRFTFLVFRDRIYEIRFESSSIVVI